MQRHTPSPFPWSFACVRCGQCFPDDAPWTCAVCGGNLEIRYEIGPEEKNSSRWLAARDDLFRYASLLPVRRLDLASPLHVGRTPLLEAKRLGKTVGLDRLFIKDEGRLPTASLKDRAGAVALVRAREMGAGVVAGASTGNAGSSMAGLCASVGQPCVIFVPEQAPAAKLTQLLVFGAVVIAVRGSYDEAFDLCAGVCRERGWFNRNTGSNPFTREGKKTCSFEICEQMNWQPPDRVIVPTGDGNIISAIWKGMRELRELGVIDRLPRIDCAQAEGSCAVARTVRRLRDSSGEPDWQQVEIEPVEASTCADSISVDAPRDGLAAVRAVVESGGETETATDEEILAAIPELARHTGVFAEPAAACAWACLKKLVARGAVNSDERVVCLITGSGLKDVPTARRAVRDPMVVDATPEAVRSLIDSLAL